MIKNETAKHVAVIGAGPAGLMAAQGLIRGGARVTVFDRMPSVARKFLMAGRGGLNLTHSEPLDAFLARYGASADQRLHDAIKAFPPKTQIKWAEGLGQETFTGSSGRVFPKAMKASPLLRAWLAKLEAQGVIFKTRTLWAGFGASINTGTSLLLQSADQPHPQTLTFDAVIFALGGASWPRLGADGGWVEMFEAAGLTVAPLEPANVSVKIAWSDILREKHAGQPLKRIELIVSGQRFRGEAMITRGGLEGGAIYAATEVIRRALYGPGPHIKIDLRPDLSEADLITRLAKAGAKDSQSTRLRKHAGLSPAAVALLNEVARPLPRETAELVHLIKQVPLTLSGFAGLDRAISTAGGLSFSTLDEHWMLSAKPGVFACGEMLDWTAPTGGYLLTACLATGRAAAEGCLAWLASQPQHTALSQPQ
jgi:uncharacterized flavoprotein (TIGR03862 family)